jgi:hypothetical protein
MHYPWEWYEQQHNPWNCSIQLIEGTSGEGYTDTPLFPGFESARPSSQARREEGIIA